MIPFEDLVSRYNVSVKGVVHVGAHEGGEIKNYSSLGIKNVVLIEANPTRFKNLLESLSTGRYCTWCSPLTYEYFNDHRTDIVKQYKPYNYAISDRTGSISFNVSNYDGGTDSIFKINRIGQQTSWVPYEHIDTIEVPTITLDILIEDKQSYNFLNIDVEGAELLVLKGATELLKNIDWIQVETQDVVRFDNSSTRPEVIAILERHGFELVTYFDTGKGWGDCLFKKNVNFATHEKYSPAPITHLVYTHSDYDNVYAVWYKQTKKYFPDSRIYLMSDKPLDTTVETSILYDDSKPYADRIISCLDNLDENEVVLFQHEDMFLYDEPLHNILNQFIELVSNDSVDMIRMLRTATVNLSHSGVHQMLYNNPNNNLFSIQPTLIKVKTLKQIFNLVSGKSIYDSEMHWERSLKGYKSLFPYVGENKRGVSHYDSRVYPHIATAITKGKWNVGEYDAELMGIFADLGLLETEN